MKPQLKVLLYLKRNEQDANNLCPLMGRITINGRRNSVAQFSTKLKVNPNLWNSTSQRLTGKSKVAIKTNREIEALLLLLRSRFDELCKTKETVLAIEVKNAFQGIATTQATLLKLFREHNEEYSQRVGINRVRNSYYKYNCTYAHLSRFVEQKYKVSDVSLKSLDLGFVEAFDRYLRVDKRHQPNTINGSYREVEDCG